ncbi:glycosyltransferase [Dyella sp. OK004]|uniref:polysaccharide deacetylase family protein n=1 Tax=Dyella sp. OK004 TaxID=1855292 RepID=UPI00210134A0|nr:glycosyltransferase [Dyella sp. OK004]
MPYRRESATPSIPKNDAARPEPMLSHVVNLVDPHVTTATASSPTTGRPLVAGFYTVFTKDDETAYRGLSHALPQLDWLMPTWLRMQGADMALQTSVDAKVVSLIHREKPDLSVLPTLQNISGRHWDGPGLARALADPTIRRERIAQIVSFLTSNQFQGVTVDFEGVPEDAHDDLRRFLAELSASMTPHHLRLVLAVPFDDDDWDYADYAKVVDFELLMAYDEHTEADRIPGSVAGMPWYDEILRRRMSELDPRHTIVAIGSYGYDWSVEHGSKPVTFEETMVRAGQSDATINFDKTAQNPHFAYSESDGSRHQVWFLDGVTAYNQVRHADAYRPFAYGVWRIGSEDPSIWTVMRHEYGAPANPRLRQIDGGVNVQMLGDGEILRVASIPTTGSRALRVNTVNGGIEDEHYDVLPQPYAIQRVAGAPGNVAITFDDGPDVRWTPRVLDILKAKKASATFFVIGQNMQASPSLVQRMVNEGHEVGNHTFSHRGYAEGHGLAMWWQLASTQRLFEALTGRSMRLFRPPYLGNAEPTTSDELTPMEQAQSLGYLTVGLHVDSDDWEELPPTLIVKRIMEQLSSATSDRHAQVILMHDGGGDRSRTVAALPLLIDTLRAKGYRLVTSSNIAGLSRDQSMPQLTGGTWPLKFIRAGFLGVEQTGSVLHWLLRLAIFLGIGRVVLLCGLALVDRIRESRRSPPTMENGDALVSVIIPAYNEEKVVLDCISHVLNSDYATLEVIVVDDGSTDATAARIRRHFAHDARVVLMSRPNAGKAHALNAGLHFAKGEVLVALDADTQFECNTISCLVRWFGDALVGAVAGNAKVGNRTNVITQWQALEYIVTQNLERRALAALGTLTVVPGAVGAWRRSVLNELGGFPCDTLAEDQDLTIAVQKAGYRALFDSEAIAWTEVPDRMGALIRQRIRWSFGTLQCLWKHRDALFRKSQGALGLVALPQMWVFQYGLALLAPLVDVLLLWQIVNAAVDYTSHRDQFDSQGLSEIMLFYGVFLATDMLAGGIAFALEKREQWHLLLWLVVQRFCYRQLLYFVTIRSIAAAWSGSLIAWGRQQRSATVRLTGLSHETDSSGYRLARANRPERTRWSSAVLKRDTTHLHKTRSSIARFP